MLLLLLAVLVCYFLIQQPKVQNWLTQKVTKKLSETLGTEVAVNHLQIDFLNHLNVKGVYIEDQNKDTLLYAGNLQFRITDWFFLKNEKPVIKYLALQDAVINVHRDKDSLHPWNFDYIIKKLSSTKTASDTAIENVTAADTSSSSLAFDIKNILLENIRVKSYDKWIGQNLIATVGKLELDANDINVPAKSIFLQKLLVDKSAITFEEYKGGKPYNPIDTIDKTMFNPDYWKVALKDIVINKTSFAYNHNFNPATPNLFDEEHISVKNLDLAIKDIKIEGDTLQADFKKLNAEERCGLIVKGMKGHLTLSPVRTTLKDLELITNNSYIADQYEMIYTRFPDFNDYINKVIMKANFSNSNISINDIGFFAPEVRNITVKTVKLNRGKFLGTVADFETDNIDIAVNNSTFDGNLKMKGLPDIDKTFIKLEATNLNTSGTELIKFVPAANTDAVAWENLQRINYKGNYTGYINDFIVDGKLSTSVGDVQSNIHLTFPKEKQPTYDGFFSTTNLNLGNIIKQKQIGAISATGNIKGEGYDLDNVNTYFKGKVNYIQAAQYNLSNIDIDGKFSNKKFDGKLSANDPNLAMDFNGKMDFSAKTPNYKLSTRLTRFDLQKLGITKTALSGSAAMDVDFSATNIDDFIGKAKLYQLNLDNGKTKIYLDSAILNSTMLGNIKTLDLQSNVADATVSGNFRLDQLHLAMQYYLSNYLPSYIAKPKSLQTQQFNFIVKTKEAEDFIQTFVPEISGGNYSTIEGAFDMFQRNMKLTVETPSFAYDGTRFENISALGYGTYDSIRLIGKTGSIASGTSTIVPNSNFNVVARTDSLFGNVTTAGGSYNIRDANLNIKGYAANNKLFINLLPSEIYLANNKWQMNAVDPFVIGDGMIKIQGFEMYSGQQKVVAHTIGNKEQDIEIRYNNIDLQEALIFGGGNANIAGNATGQLLINDYLNNRIFSGSIATTDITLNKDIIGQLAAQVEFNEADKKVYIKDNSGLKYDGYFTEFYGSVDLAQTEPILNLHAILDNTNLKFAETFLSDFISNTNGFANGKVDIVGPTNNYKVDGNLKLNDVQTKVNYLGTTYFIDKAEVRISEKEIDFGNSLLYDAPKDQPRRVAKFATGLITHKNFQDLTFDIVLLSDEFQYLNTTANDNSDYYGPVVAKGSLFVNGPIENINLLLVGTTLKGTHLHIPVSDEYDVNAYDYMTFSTYDDLAGTKKNLENNKTTTEKLLKVELVVTVTPEAEISIILDNRTQEKIYGRGEGILDINIDLGKEFKMDGQITTAEGSYYDYKFNDIIAKKLRIEPGGTITWNGDPLKARLNLLASYQARSKLSLAPLIAGSSGTASSDDNNKYNTFVNILLKGQMLKPEITYDIVQPDNTDIATLGYGKLQELRRDQNEMIKQVGYMLFADQFLGGNFRNANATVSVLNNINSTVAPTLSNMVTNTMNKVLKTKDFSVDLDYTALDNSNILNTATGTSIGNNDNVRVRLKKGWLDNRIQLEVDNNFGYNRTANQLSAPIGDFKLLYLVQPDGRLRLSMFSTAFSDINTGLGNNNRKTGLSFIYRKNFDNLSDIFSVVKFQPKTLTPDTTIKAAPEKLEGTQ
jgi:hypothetical protein